MDMLLKQLVVLRCVEENVRRIQLIDTLAECAPYFISKEFMTLANCHGIRDGGYNVIKLRLKETN